MLEPFDAAAPVYLDVNAAGFVGQVLSEPLRLFRVDLHADGTGGGPFAAENGPVAEKRLDVHVMRRNLVDDPLVDAGTGLAAWVCHAGMVAEFGGGVKGRLKLHDVFKWNFGC